MDWHINKYLKKKTYRNCKNFLLHVIALLFSKEIFHKEIKIAKVIFLYKKENRIVIVLINVLLRVIPLLFSKGIFPKDNKVAKAIPLY